MEGVCTPQPIQKSIREDLEDHLDADDLATFGPVTIGVDNHRDHNNSEEGSEEESGCELEGGLNQTSIRHRFKTFFGGDMTNEDLDEEEVDEHRVSIYGFVDEAEDIASDNDDEIDDTHEPRQQTGISQTTSH
jgi:hypothetical protein